MKRFATLLAATMLVPPLTAADAAAQRETPGVTLELNAGASDFGRFLEQLAVTDVTFVDDIDGQFLLNNQFEREVTASTGFTLGGSIGVWPWEKTGARLGFSWTTTDLEFDNDTPLGGVLVDGVFAQALAVNLDRDDVADLNNYLFSLDVIRYLLDPRDNRFTPYVAAGIVGGWWDLDGGGVVAVIDDVLTADAIVAADGTTWEWGANGGLGLDVGINRRWSARAEVNTFSIGNPFDGDDSYGVISRTFVTTDEPSRVRMTRLTLAVTYSFRFGRPLLGAR